MFSSGPMYLDNIWFIGYMLVNLATCECCGVLFSKGRLRCVCVCVCNKTFWKIISISFPDSLDSETGDAVRRDIFPHFSLSLKLWLNFVNFYLFIYMSLDVCGCYVQKPSARKVSDPLDLNLKATMSYPGTMSKLSVRAAGSLYTESSL